MSQISECLFTCCFCYHFRIFVVLLSTRKRFWIYLYIFFVKAFLAFHFTLTISRVPLSLSLSCVTRQKPRGHAAFFLSRHAWRTKHERDYSKSTLCTFCLKDPNPCICLNKFTGKKLTYVLTYKSYILCFFISVIGNLGQRISPTSSITAIYFMTTLSIGYYKLSLDWPYGVTWSSSCNLLLGHFSLLS